MTNAFLESAEGDEWSKKLFFDQPPWKLCGQTGIQTFDSWISGADSDGVVSKTPLTPNFIFMGILDKLNLIFLLKSPFNFLWLCVKLLNEWQTV